MPRLAPLSAAALSAFLLAWAACGPSVEPEQPRPERKLWYAQPAEEWNEALPIGNGRLAAMIFGGVEQEHFQLNEDTVWSGEKRDRSNPAAREAVPEIRRLLREGHPARAQELADRAMISIPRELPVYQPLGDLLLDFELEGVEPGSYRRELDLDTGLSSVTFSADGVQYKREAFASFPCKCIVMRLSASAPGMISFRASIGREADATARAEGHRLILTGQALPKRAPGERETGVRFRAEVDVQTDGGEVRAEGDGLQIAGADSCRWRCKTRPRGGGLKAA